jgi:predicted Rossmann fold nucleotide-binding protein DprA/Smf involved in DNA uptake
VSSDSFNYIHRQILDELRRKARPSDWLIQQQPCAVLDFTEALLQLKQSGYIVLQGKLWYLTKAGLQVFFEVLKTL